MRRSALAALALLAGPALAADPFPSRSGESGLLDVPDAEVLDKASGLFGVETGFDHVPGTPNDFGPGPLALGVGLGSNLEAGLAMREWGLPGDPRPTRLLFTAALKWRLLEASGTRPAVAVDATADRFNWKDTQGVRLIASTAQMGRLRFAAFVGGEAHGPTPYSLGVTAGVAASILHRSGLETVIDALTGPEGSKVGAALRWTVRPNVGISIGADWLPEVHGLRAGVGLGILSPAPPTRAAPLALPAAAAPVPPPAAPAYLDDRPRFRLRIPVEEVPGGPVEPRHLQYGPMGTAPAAAPAAKALTTEETRELGIAARERQLDARERRLRALEADLAARDERLADEASRLDAAEQEMVVRGRQLDTRERSAAAQGSAPAATGEAEARAARAREAEAEARQRERELQASVARPAARETQARAREAPLRRAVAGRQADLARQKVKARQVDLREEICRTRDRLLGALEDRLAAGRERADLAERALAARRERVDARARTLAAREDRLLALEASRKAPAIRRLAPEAPLAVAVVKSPTSIARSAVAAAAAAGAGRAALHPGVAVEKTVAAATVVYFPAAGQPMRELDREAVEGIARLAASEGAEVMVWARAQGPGLMGEAARRAEELKLFVVKAGPVPDSQVVTRITVRPAATGVDVVVSALRETDEAAPAAGASGAAAGAAALLEGESGKRQVRDALAQHRPDLEGCFGPEMRRQAIRAADAVLRLTVDRQGRVVGVAAAQPPLAGGEVDQCLSAAARGWRFPAAPSDYAVEVPVTLVGAASKP